MPNTTVTDTVFSYLTNIIPGNININTGMTLIDDLGFDSLDMIELILHLEEELNINVAADDNAVLDAYTIGDLITSIEMNYDIV